MILNDLWKEQGEQRRKEINNLKEQVKQSQKQNQADRSLMREELNIQAEETRQSLKDFIANLQQQGDEDRKQRQAEKKARQQQNSERQQEVLDLMQNMSRQRDNYRAEFSANARILSEELQSFRQNLTANVWGVEGFVNNKKTSFSSNSIKTKVKKKTAPKPKQEVASKSKTIEEEIYQFIQQQNGVSLVDIGEQFGIERKAIIELMRELVQKGTIEQRDRLYFNL